MQIDFDVIAIVKRADIPFYQRLIAWATEPSLFLRLFTGVP